ncbi:general stress protein 26 [Paenibacillus piri]|uniref:General stress protein 26 n=2 Tax=Paenibacillus piri TaxID=2547395 RepID=A0A4R5KXX2_9BACL|nr:general stress protein 26 [Paenibacillus piri]
MSTGEALRKSAGLLERSEIAMVGSNDQDGYPNIKAMFKIEAEGINNIWFSTNTSSKRVSQFRSDPRACVYFYDHERFSGLLLVGDIEVVTDSACKQRLWRQGWEAYYPQGVTDPEYCALQFAARWGNYYHGLQNVSFDL